MKHFHISMPLLLALLVILSSCSGKKEDPSPALSSVAVSDTLSLPLHISKAQLVHDWTVASYSYGEYGEKQGLPYYYKCVDLDRDGNIELLLKGSETYSPSAILFYHGTTMIDCYYVPDGYYTLGIAEPADSLGHFTMLWDDHMGEDRVWTTYYFDIRQSDYENVGYHAVGLGSYNEEGEEQDDGLDDRQLPEGYECYETEQFEYVKGWLTLDLTDEEKAIATTVSQDDLAALFAEEGKNDSADANEAEYSGSALQYRTYKGQIGPYHITMYIEGGEDFGYYVYDNRPNSIFRLRCIESQDSPEGYNDVILEEHAPNGVVSGTFKGKLEGRGDGFNGQFTNSKGKTFDFELHEQN